MIMTTLKNVRPMGAPATDLYIADGRFAASAEGEVIDCGGRILFPGLVEAHTHLDKSLLGLPWYRNEVGPRLIDKITNEREVKVSLSLDPQLQSERQAIQSLAYGSTHFRSHVDVDTHHGLAGIEGVMATREKLKDYVDIEIVAFPQASMMPRPGTVELMVENLSVITHQHLVLFIALRDPDLDRIAEARPPATGTQAGTQTGTDLNTIAEAIAARAMRRERREVLDRLTRMGVLCLDTTPQMLTTDLISRYIDIKAEEKL